VFAAGACVIAAAASWLRGGSFELREPGECSADEALAEPRSH